MFRIIIDWLLDWNDPFENEYLERLLDLNESVESWGKSKEEVRDAGESSKNSSCVLAFSR